MADSGESGEKVHAHLNGGALGLLALVLLGLLFEDDVDVAGDELGDLVALVGLGWENKKGRIS